MTRVQADIRSSIRDWLTNQGTGAALVRRRVPDGWTPSAGSLLVVADDGGPGRLPISSRHTIRLTAYAAGETEARNIAVLAAGKLAESSPRPPGVSHISGDVSAVLDGRDKATGAALASVLLTATARTVEV
ncbi:MAG: hypothetical protein HYZ39_16395 [Mycolicibacterium cosmeticum]|nr:hypothetical protein [Mycolicibacterium cosmeticum]